MINLGKYKLGVCYQMPRRKTSKKNVMTQKQIVNINTRSVRRDKSTKPHQPQRIPVVMSQYPTFYPIYNQGNQLTQPITAVRNMPTVMRRVEQDIPQQFTALPQRLSPELSDVVETPVRTLFGSENPNARYGFYKQSDEGPMSSLSALQKQQNALASFSNRAAGGGGLYASTGSPVKSESPLADMSKGGYSPYNPSPYESAESKTDIDLYD